MHGIHMNSQYREEATVPFRTDPEVMGKLNIRHYKMFFWLFYYTSNIV